jgi:hypothetical protein
MKNTRASSIVCFTILVLTLRDHTKYFDITGLLPLMLCTAEMTYEYELYLILLIYCRHKNSDYQYCWMKNTRVSSVVCFTILVLPVLLDEEYCSFQYFVLYNTSTRNTSIVMLQYRKSSIVYIWYWMYQYRAFTILEYQNHWSIHNTGMCAWQY